MSADIKLWKVHVCVFAVVGGVLWVPVCADEADRYASCVKESHDSTVRLETEIGNIDVALFASRAPITACNFLRYADNGFFDNGKFFRTLTPDNQRDKPVKVHAIQADAREDVEDHFPPIPLERTNKTGIHHVDGAISMARDEPDTATSSFSISIGDEHELDYGGKRNPDGQGFAAFGRVIRGMDVVKRIWKAHASGERLTPPIRIKRVYRVTDRAP